MGDIGRPIKHIELEPLENPGSTPVEPTVVPVPERQPAREPVPA